MNRIRSFMASFARDRYNHLLMALISLFILEPLYELTGIKFPLVGLLFLGVLLLALRVSAKNVKVFHMFAVACVVGFFLWIFASYETIPLAANEAIYLIGFTVVIFIFAYPIYAMGRHILESTKVSVDMIKGAICLYLLIGMLWSVFYTIVDHFDPNAFRFATDHPDSYMYYSYTVLTTVGFGDITPVNNFASNLTTLEAIVGQMFLAVFVARLVGLHLAAEMKKKNEQ